MLGGLDPVIIFQFSTLATSLGATVERIPVISKIPTLVEQPPIPVYLSEKTFNIAIGGTSKSVDIQTESEGLTNGAPVEVSQSPIQSSVEIEIEGKSDSVALILVSAMIDQVYDKVRSDEYAISLLYGATTIFRAKLHSYSVESVPGTDKLIVKIKLSKGSKNPAKTNPVETVPGSTGTIPVGA